MLLAGCARPPIRPAIPSAPPPLSRPSYEKTFGEARFGGVATLLISYKDIRILIDPLFFPPGPVGPYEQKLQGMAAPGMASRMNAPAVAVSSLPPIDYLLLTDTQPHHFGTAARAAISKDIKAIAPPEDAERLRLAGFTGSKGLEPGRRLLLQKNGAYLFVSAIQTRNSVSGEQVNFYLLEFDNGKNVIITGETIDEDAVRRLVYELRDDGKEIALAFVYGGGLRATDGKLE
ncbi:MAG: MBL fold metallo-hydrolase, partial [Candidatus Saccharimonadales bacterium]